MHTIVDTSVKMIPLPPRASVMCPAYLTVGLSIDRYAILLWFYARHFPAKYSRSQDSAAAFFPWLTLVIPHLHSYSSRGRINDYSISIFHCVHRTGLAFIICCNINKSKITSQNKFSYRVDYDFRVVFSIFLYAPKQKVGWLFLQLVESFPHICRYILTSPPW